MEAIAGAKVLHDRGESGGMGVREERKQKCKASDDSSNLQEFLQDDENRVLIPDFLKPQSSFVVGKRLSAFRKAAQTRLGDGIVLIAETGMA